METKHTPGPWIAGTYDNSEFRITGPRGTLPEIAIIPADRLERVENARLIAAAPELLAALQRLLFVMNQDDDGDFFICAEATRDIKTARAAIAKATAQ
jgi:hypothetical protein